MFMYGSRHQWLCEEIGLMKFLRNLSLCYETELIQRRRCIMSSELMKQMGNIAACTKTRFRPHKQHDVRADAHVFSDAEHGRDPLPNLERKKKVLKGTRGFIFPFVSLSRRGGLRPPGHASARSHERREVHLRLHRALFLLRRATAHRRLITQLSAERTLERPAAPLLRCPNTQANGELAAA